MNTMIPRIIRKPKDAGLTKGQIRSKILKRLKIQKEDQRDKKSAVIKARLFKTTLFRKAKTVMFYISFDGEVNTQDMIKEAQKLGKSVAVPVCENDGSIRPCLIQDKARLIKGFYGTRQPAIIRCVKLEDLDLLVVPGLAFDKKGNRLGRGRGCYDFFLKRLPKKIPSIGLAFDFQILPFIPTTKRDVSVDRIIFV